MMPPCDQTGVPGLVALTHFHSSTTSGSAFLMSLRILLRVSPRQSPSSAILFEMSSDADRPRLAPDFSMFSPLEVPDTFFICMRLLCFPPAWRSRIVRSSASNAVDEGRGHGIEERSDGANPVRGLQQARHRSSDGWVRGRGEIHRSRSG